MSSPAHPTSTNRTQLTLSETPASRYIHTFPRGVSLRYESTESFKAFLAGNTHVRYVVINFSDAETIIRRHETVHAVLEHWQVPIVTATEEDASIYGRQRDDIRRVLKHIQPAIYIPDAGTVYWQQKGQSEEEARQSQKNGLKFYIQRLNWVMKTIEENDWEISVLPLGKGMYKWHYEFLKDCYQRHGFQNYAFYTKQYTNGGNHIRKLLDHMQNLIDVMNAKNIFAIARLGENHLERFPPQVTGTCGLKQFVDKCKADGRFREDLFPDWRDEVENTLLDKPRVIQ